MTSIAAAGPAGTETHGWKRLARGAALEAVGFGTSQIIRIGSNLVLTRLLFPAAFGLMAMVSLIMYGLVMLTDVGIQQAVIRSERGDDEVFLDTAWSMQVGRGFALWLLACALTWPISMLFREPQLLQLLPVGTAVSAITGMTSMRVFTMRRRLRIAPLVALDLTGQVLSSLAMIVLASVGFGVWSLVLGVLLGAVVQMALSHALPGEHRPRFKVDADSSREIIGFGRWIFASSAMTFVAGRADQFILGTMLGAASLGLYNLALGLASLPEALADRVMGGVLFPHYAGLQQREHPGEFSRSYYRSRLWLDGAIHGSLGGLIALAPWLVGLLYDPRYAGAASMLQVLALRSSIAMWTAPCELALVAMGLSKYGFRRNFAVAAATLVGMPAGGALGGITGLLWSSALARAAGLAVVWPAARSRGFLRLRRELLVPMFLGGGYGLGRFLAWLFGS